MQPQQQYAPHQPAPMAPVFVEVTVPTTEPGPGFGDIIGRPVAIVVRQAGQSPAFDKADKRADANGNVPTVWFDLYIGGEGQIVYGAAPKANPPRPLPTHTVTAPCVFRNQMSSNDLIVRALSPNAGQPSFITGMVSTIGRAFCLNAFDATNRHIAEQLHAHVTALVTGTLPEPVPQPTGYAAPQPQQVTAPTHLQYAPQQQQFAPPMPQPVQVPQPTAQPQQQYMTAQQSYAAVPPSPLQQMVEPPSSPLQHLPPGMTPEFWATLSDAQKAMMLQQGAVPAQPANPY